VQTYEWVRRFRRDFMDLTPEQQRLFLQAVVQFVEDLAEAKGFRKGLRVKGVQGAPGVFEMTWANDGRATFEYGPPLVEGQSHIIWRRVGTHVIFTAP